MKLLLLCSLFISIASATVLQNGQVREMIYPDTAIASVAKNSAWKTYAPGTSEISYKGRWDSKYISWWTAPGLKFGFQSSNVAISFGNYTSPGVLIAYRLDGLDWIFTNVTANTTHLLISPDTISVTTPLPTTRTLEIRVTNWGYGIQLTGIHLDSKGKLVKVPSFAKTIEFIGDSLMSGYTDTYEGLSGHAWGVGAGLGNVEFGITAYPGICLVDQNCWGNPRGQIYQWKQTSDTSSRAYEIYGDKPELWDFKKHPAADLTIINIGTNDNNTHNNVSSTDYYNTYITLVNDIHKTWPKSQIIIFALWNGFGQVGNTWVQGGAFVDEIYQVYKHFENKGYVYYFNTTGILQHNDIGPQWHPTDVGQIKLASHLLQFIKLTFGWEFGATGPEVQHDTLYWNDQTSY